VIAQIEEELIQPFRVMFGTRLSNIGSGSAAVSSDVLTWMRRVWNRTGVSDSYGSTEAGGISNDFRTIHNVEIKLRDVPDLGYFSTDNPPRGEIVVRTK
jgi:long-subunit acyl-CoA synthetase (AMP-forming)